MPDHRVAIVAGARTPFVKGGQAFASLDTRAQRDLLQIVEFKVQFVPQGFDWRR